jgi:hypothetical protein
MTPSRKLPARAGLHSVAAAALVLGLAACDAPRHAAGPADVDSPAFSHTDDHLNAMVDRAWGGDVQWEFVRPRPPGIGTGPNGVAPGLEQARVRLYQIAPVDAADPLSPPIDLSHLGLINIAGRDHVLAVPQQGGREFTGVGRTVPVLHPGWAPFPPFGAAQCNNFVGPDVEGDIAWQRVEPTPHPCGWAAVVYGARLDGDECVRPLTTVARVEAAAAAGLVTLVFPPEPPWPFAIRPLTDAGGGRIVEAAPACVPAGERVGT